MKVLLLIQAAILAAIAGFAAGSEAADIYKCERVPEQAPLTGLTSCQYVQRYCRSQNYFIDYYSMYYCSRPALAIPAIVIISIVIFSLLASTSNAFLIPTLKHICSSLNLPPSVAGVTLLAFGNSAPDIFTSLAGMRSADVPLVLSSLVGAGVCITTLCLGMVLSIARPKIENPIWLVRDLVSYFIATSLIIAVCQTREIALWHGLAFISLYIIYAGSVIFSFAYDAIPSKLISVDSFKDGISYPFLQIDGSKFDTSCKDFRLYDFGPDLKRVFDSEQEPSVQSGQSSTRSNLLRLRSAIEYPFTILRRVTIPRLDGDFSEGEQQQLVFAPVAISVLFSVAFLDSSVQTLSNCLMLGGVLTSVAAYRYLPESERPKPTLAFAFIGFLSAIAWLSIFASEMVAIVQAVGVFCHVSSAVLGLTVLAIASSFGDLMTNITVARRGGAASAVSACFGAPIMNDLLGLGIALSLACLQTYPAPIQFSIDSHVTLGWSYLTVSLIVSLLAFLLSNFQPGRSFGFALIAIYVSFIVASLFVL